ncbi:peptidoglycan DD-metalloendopeptidase family protein [Aestuariibacter sp. AA17]|uniref:Peptidoglycan DD-metalloendopeptidase family protein n=1 Tax=Fluctibacter corallii TaxID=2984329 RepID=A0ABT3A4V8_9ALTE|nr:peptidoglycan DD-metalloendopeptidase family protein [Aestuariibacter sp. AA17]MCV2883710.1 peptidoglycan DD-metalloendopeptidase family protein [Aestuariibacter sp. AA17]
MLKNTIKQLPIPHKFMLSGIVALLLLMVFIPSDSVEASRHTEVKTLELGKRYQLDLTLSQGSEADALPIDEQQNWHAFTIQKGDNLAKIFNRAGLSAQDTYRVSKAGSLAKKLLSIKPGQSLSILKDSEGQFVALQYAYSQTETLQISHENSGFQSEILTKPIETRLNFAQGEINSSFWNAGKRANMSDNQIMSLAGIFGWDIDFALEIREGDHFNVVYEEQFIDGEFIGYGDIVAAEFTNQGETFTAIRHNDGNYYTPEGRSMRKSFLRAPVNFKYISSSFSKKRFHPVQKRWKAHRGVDYAARTGTPVVAAGDGKVIRATYDKFNGHHVFIQHGEKYVTKYIHFSKRAVKRGQHVKQGQVIGYVGATGLAAGPHLHYEFLVDGVHRNPRTVSLPKAKPIAEKDKAEFSQLAAQRVALLENNKRIMLAMN